MSSQLQTTKHMREKPLWIKISGEKKTLYLDLQELHIGNVNTEHRPDMYESCETQGNKIVSIQWNRTEKEPVHWKLKNKKYNCWNKNRKQWMC